MSCFDYPFDAKYLLRKKKSIKKDLIENKKAFQEKRIAILGGSTTDEIKDQIDIFLLNQGIKAIFYQSEYSKYWEDAIFGNEELDKFNPDVVYFHTNWRNIQQFPQTTDSKDEVEIKLNNEISKLHQMWSSIESKFKCVIIQNNFDRPNYRLLGNMDIWDYRGRSNFLARLNDDVYKYASEHNNFYVNDIDYISSVYGILKWNDSVYWNMYKYCLPLDAIPSLAFNISNIIKAIYGKNKKVLTLDLDNTLWGGVIGDDGVNGISIGPETSVGQVYSEFQSYCKDLKSIGVVLAIASKNDEDNAINGLNHRDSVLKPDDFVAIKANWDPKDVNISQIAKELNVGTDSIVFVDDNPAERAIVSGNVSGISCINQDRVERFVEFIDQSGYFETITLSKEDLQKTELYHAREKMKNDQGLYKDYNEFLRSLEMRADISRFDEAACKRIAQLTNKSNQFNLTTLRCSEEDINNYMLDKECECLYGRLEDKYADNGIISVVVAEVRDKEMHIKLWLMSCRVLKRGMEDAMMNTIVAHAKKRNIEKIVGYFYPTSKNMMVKNFYGEMGFKLLSEDEIGNSEWELIVNNYLEKKHNIRLNEV